MGLECISEKNGAVLRWGWICDKCGEEITDIHSGHMDYVAWKPLPKDPEERKKEMDKRMLKKRFATFHAECAPSKSAGLYWDYIGYTVWQLMSPEDRKTAKSKLAESVRSRPWRMD